MVEQSKGVQHRAAIPARAVCRPLALRGCAVSPTPHAVTGWAMVPVIRYRHHPAPFRSGLVLRRYACGAMSAGCPTLENMTDAQLSPPGDPAPPGAVAQPWPAQQPPADPSPDPEPRSAQHLGRHHYAGHPSGRNAWAACGEWRPVAGNDACPVCPQVCPGCGSYYSNPFPVDPRDG